MRLSLTKSLLLVLLAALGFAAWSWWRPYDWRPDPAAGFRIKGVEVTRDHGYHWLLVHLEKTGKKAYDLARPARLLLEGGRELEPADTRMTGNPDQGVTTLSFKFWLEPGDLNDPLRLRLNDGILSVKATTGEPALGLDGHDYFNSNRW